MPPAVRPRRPLHKTLSGGLGKAGSALSGFGKAVGAAAFGNRKARKEEIRIRQHPAVETVEQALERVETALENPSEYNVRSAALGAAQLKSIEEARAFFIKLFESEDERVQQFARELYIRYRRFNGRPLGGNFSRLDEHYMKLAGRN